MDLASVRPHNSIRINHYLLSIFLSLSGTAWAGSWHYGYGFNPDEAMAAAIEAAKRESEARCLGRNWKPDIERDCQYAGNGQTYFDKNGNDVGAYECVAEGSNNRGSCP